MPLRLRNGSQSRLQPLPSRGQHQGHDELWGVKSSDVPSQLVVIGRYLRGDPKVALHDKLRNLLLHVKGGRDTVASVIAAFTERHGGRFCHGQSRAL